MLRAQVDVREVIVDRSVTRPQIDRFGRKGRRNEPDFLAGELIKNGWHLKPIHRLILLSNTYRQSSSRPDPARYEKDDPENRLLWRFNRRRLNL